MQEDSYNADGLNLYAYCRNNPVYYVDPSGNICEKVANTIIDKINNNQATRNEQKKLAAYLRNKDRNGTPLTPMETHILNQISDHTYLTRYGQDMPNHIYTRNGSNGGGTTVATPNHGQGFSSKGYNSKLGCV